MVMFLHCGGLSNDLLSVCPSEKDIMLSGHFRMDTTTFSLNKELSRSVARPWLTCPSHISSGDWQQNGLMNCHTRPG